MENKKNKKTIGAPKIMGFIHVFLNELGSGTSISHGKLIVYENSPDAKIIEKAVQYVKERALTANEICQGNIYDSKTKKQFISTGYSLINTWFVVQIKDAGCFKNLRAEDIIILLSNMIKSKVRHILYTVLFIA